MKSRGWIPPVAVAFLSLILRAVLLFTYWPDVHTNIDAFKMDSDHPHDYWWILYA